MSKAIKVTSNRARHLKMLAGESTPTHGTYSTYNNYECRCDPCKTAKSIVDRQAYEKRLKLAAKPIVPEERTHADTSDRPRRYNWLGVVGRRLTCRNVRARRGVGERG